MITRRSGREIECMRSASAIVAEVLEMCRERARPGVTTAELDEAAESHILEREGVPLFKGYKGFPKVLCTSVNEEVVHGVPGARVLREGDILSVDVGVRLDGYCGDAAATFPIGEVSEDGRRVIAVCRAALERAIEAIRPNMRLSMLCGAIQRYVESEGCSVVRQYTGHGIGREMHEEPQVPNFVTRGMADPILRPGTVVAVEPMVNLGGCEVEVLGNGWTVVTKDRSLSAHWEHTVAIRETGADVLTALRN